MNALRHGSPCVDLVVLMARCSPIACGSPVTIE